MFSWSLLAANIFVELAQELLAGLINSVGKTSRNNSVSFFFFLLGIREIFQFAFPQSCKGMRGQSLELIPLEHIHQAPPPSPTPLPHHSSQAAFPGEPHSGVAAP